LERYQEIERSIIKKYRKDIWRPFVLSVQNYQLIQKGDRVAACISGGKDSMLMAKLLQEIQRHGDFPFDLVFLVMDPGYHPANRKRIEENAKILNVPITIRESNIFQVVADIKENPCYLCARMRRGFLYSHAKELGCNKIALGHHFDDVIETILMGMLYSGQMQTMMPKLHSNHFEGMELIRPMYLVHEKAIINWMQYHDLHFLQCACRLTENYEENERGANNSKRQEMKKLIQHFRQINPVIDKNIFRSAENINLRTILSYQKDGVVHHFLDDYK